MIPHEDALLARLSQHAQSCREFEQEVTAELLEEAIDRIAADAERIAASNKLIAFKAEQYLADQRTIAAAEARAQRTENAMKEADEKLAGMWSWNEDGRSKMLHTWFGQASTILRTALAAEPEGKDG